MKFKKYKARGVGLAMKKLLILVACLTTSYSYAADLTGVFRDTLPPLDGGFDGFIYTMTTEPTGRLLVGGQYEDAWVIIAYLANGTRDTTFADQGVTSDAPSPSMVTGIQVLPGSGFAVVGNVMAGSPVVETAIIVAYADDGTPSFGEAVTTGTTLGFYFENDVALGVFGTSNDQVPFLSDLSTVTFFNALAPGYISNFQSISGTSYIAGSSNGRAFLLRLGANPGVVQDTLPPFNTDEPGQIYGMLIDNDRNVVVCGNYNNVFTMVRYYPTGSRDTSFGDNGVVQNLDFTPSNAFSVIQDAAGNYYVAGETTNSSTTVFSVAQYTNAGALVTSFGTNGLLQFTTVGAGSAYALALQSAGSLLAAGQVIVAGVQVPVLASFTDRGTLIPLFTLQGIQTYTVFGAGSLNAIATSGNDFIYAAGQAGNQATIVAISLLDTTINNINNGF